MVKGKVFFCTTKEGKYHLSCVVTLDDATSGKMKKIYDSTVVRGAVAGILVRLSDDKKSFSDGNMLWKIVGVYTGQVAPLTTLWATMMLGIDEFEKSILRHFAWKQTLITREENFKKLKPEDQNGKMNEWATHGYIWMFNLWEKLTPKHIPYNILPIVDYCKYTAAEIETNLRVSLDHLIDSLVDAKPGQDLDDAAFVAVKAFVDTNFANDVAKARLVSAMNKPFDGRTLDENISMRKLAVGINVVAKFPSLGEVMKTFPISLAELTIDSEAKTVQIPGTGAPNTLLELAGVKTGRKKVLFDATATVDTVREWMQSKLFGVEVAVTADVAALTAAMT